MAEIKRLGEEFKNVSVSHATLNPLDLIENLLPHVDENLQNRGRDLINLAQQDERVQPEDLIDDLFYWYEDACDYLDNIAPEGCYFGAHPGDGSDLGFWEEETEGEEA